MATAEAVCGAVVPPPHPQVKFGRPQKAYPGMRYRALTCLREANFKGGSAVSFFGPKRLWRGGWQARFRLCYTDRASLWGCSKL